MSTQTTRLELVRPVTTDVVSELRTAIATNADHLDHAVVYDEGPLSSRPDATVGSPSEEVGNLYLVTDGPVPILWRNAGTKWVPMTTPTFSAHPPNSTSTVPSSAFGKVNFGAEDWDDMGWYTPATSRFLPTVAGVYKLTVAVRLQDNLPDGKVLYAALYKNGASIGMIDHDVSASSANAGMVAGSMLVQANGTSDYFEVWALAEADAALAVSADSRFQGEFVRPS